MVVGPGVGFVVGPGDGFVVGPGVGFVVGPGDGLVVGPGVGLVVGPGVGLVVGPGVGLAVGPGVGLPVGAGVSTVSSNMPTPPLLKVAGWHIVLFMTFLFGVTVSRTVLESLVEMPEFPQTVLISIVWLPTPFT